MEIRDVIHGSIFIEASELPVIDSRYFQRLRQIKQLGFSENSYPSATHNRYVHSLGAMETVTRAFDTIFSKGNSPRSPFHRFRAVARLAALLHDIGHGPLSHTTEFAMPNVQELGMSGRRKATHEDYTLKMITGSGLTKILQKTGHSHGFGPLEIAALIDPNSEYDGNFFTESIDGQTVDFKPLLQQLISSEIDADRMDYLRRDSWFAGVNYGLFDFDWLVGSLTYHIKEGKAFLGLHHRALYAFEDFLISRFHMFLMVYFHHKSVVFDEMLGQYFASTDCDYALPSDIESYCDYNDAHLAAHLARSSNEWAKRITEKRPYRVLVELHSGIPATKTAIVEQQRLLARIERDLLSQGIHYLSVESTSELSKYFRKPGHPIFVRYDNHYSAPSFIRLEQCTDLFQRYSEKRTIRRLYVSPERYLDCRHQGRGAPFAYEDGGSEAKVL